MTDDITFCASPCDRKDCFRHPSQMLEPWMPHSMAYLMGSGYCPHEEDKMLKKDMIDPCDEFFQTVLICAVRYSIGRATYMPGLVTDWIKGHMRGKLSEKTLGVMKRDIDGTPVEQRGMECDRRVWARFREWLEEESKCENQEAKT